jgi:hypothetical protein
MKKKIFCVMLSSILSVSGIAGYASAPETPAKVISTPTEIEKIDVPVEHEHKASIIIKKMDDARAGAIQIKIPISEETDENVVIEELQHVAILAIEGENEQTQQELNPRLRYNHSHYYTAYLMVSDIPYGNGYCNVVEQTVLYCQGCGYSFTGNGRNRTTHVTGSYQCFA